MVQTLVSIATNRINKMFQVLLIPSEIVKVNQQIKTSWAKQIYMINGLFVHLGAFAQKNMKFF